MKLLSQIKKDMEFNNSLYNLIEVLKEISLSQYRALEKKIKSFEKILIAIENLFETIDLENAKHPFINTGNRMPGVIAITSDAGLLGGLNLEVMNLAIREAEATTAKLIVIGERGKIYASESNIPFVSFGGIKDEAIYSQALQFRDYIVGEELHLHLGALKVFYPYPLSIMSQQIRTMQLFPFSKPARVKSVISEIATSGIIVESSIEDIMEYLLYLSLGHKFYEIFGLARLAELSARFVHLEDSKTRIEQLNKQLKLQYFRQRHEFIDRNIRELFAARLAFR